MTEPSTLSKSELQAQLEHAKSNYVLGLAAISLFSNQKSIEHLRFSHAAFGKYFVGFEQVADLLGHPPAQTQQLKEFLTMLIRALLKESFENVGEYARQTDVTPES
jgi:hypothetical protein